jgi:FkbM family methyltransferase
MSLASLAKRYQNIDHVLPMRWRLPVRYRAQSLLGALEPEIYLLPEILRDAAGTTALDVGANVGIYSYVLHHLGLQVHALEPQPDSAAVLSAWAKGRHAVTVHNVAAGAAASHLTLHVPVLNGKPVSTRASFFPGGGEELQIQVPVVTLDGIGLRGVSFIKIDVEGFEHEVLRGANALLDEYHPTILMEMDRDRLARDEFCAIVALLRDKGYRCYVAGAAGELLRCEHPWNSPPHAYNFIFSTLSHLK